MKILELRLCNFSLCLPGDSYPNCGRTLMTLGKMIPCNSMFCFPLHHAWLLSVIYFSEFWFLHSLFVCFTCFTCGLKSMLVGFLFVFTTSCWIKGQPYSSMTSSMILNHNCNNYFPKKCDTRRFWVDMNLGGDIFQPTTDSQRGLPWANNVFAKL